MSLEIKKFMPAEGEEPTVWEEFKGFQVQIKYVSPGKWGRLVKQYFKGMKAPGGRMLTIDDFDDRKFREIIADQVIVDWKGLTPELLRKMIVFDLKAAKEALKEKGLTEMPCIKKNKITLLEEVPSFSDFLASVALKIDRFNFEAKRKNSHGSSGGG